MIELPFNLYITIRDHWEINLEPDVPEHIAWNHFLKWTEDQNIKVFLTPDGPEPFIMLTDPETATYLTLIYL